MKLIDTHSHLYHKNFLADWDAVVARTRETCSHVFLPNVDLESIPRMHLLADQHPELFFPMMGLHPCDVKEDFREILAQMEIAFSQRNYVGVGETGLDYFWDKTFLTEQKESLRIQIAWAKEKSLPLILHCRDSMDDVIEIIDETQDGRLKGIFHCFTGSESQAEKIVSMGFLLGIGGVLTYKNSGLSEALKNIALDHLVLETDSPYLTPVPHRGKRNESSYVKYVAEKLAEVKEVDIEVVAEKTGRNALRVFGMGSV